MRLIHIFRFLLANVFRRILFIIYPARTTLCWLPAPFITPLIAQVTLRKGSIYWLAKRVKWPVSPAEWVGVHK